MNLKLKALQKAKNSSLEKKRDSMKYNTYTNLYKQNINMERIKLQEIKKTSRNLLRISKNNIFEITKEIYLNYFCENMKDIIIVEKILLILEPLIASKNLIIHKKEESKTKKAQIESEINKKNNELQARGRKATKEIRHAEINLVSGKNSIEKKTENGRYKSISKDKTEKKRDLSVSNVSDRKKIKKKRKEVLNVSLSKSRSPDMQRETREAFKSNDFSVSKIDDTKLNSKKKRRRTKRKNKTDAKQNTGNLSEDKSYISDDNVEKNKLNFFQVLKNVTTNMLLESKIKGENVQYVVEPDVIPDLDKILAEPASKTQRNNNDFSKQINKNMNLSNDDYDYNNITDRSNIHVNNQRNKNLNLISNRLSNNNKNKDNNVLKKSTTSINSKDNKNVIYKIKENEANKSIVINITVDEEKDKVSIYKKAKINNNIPPTDRSGIYRLNDNSNHDLSKDNRLELVSTNDKNEFRNKGKDISEKSNLVKETNNLVVKIKENKTEIGKDIEAINIKNYDIKNEDIVLKEKIDENEKIKTKNTNEVNSLRKNSKNTTDKPLKKIVNDNNTTKKRKNSDGCKCACSIF